MLDRLALRRVPKVSGAPSCTDDVAVVIQTTLRPSLLRAVRSVFAQDFKGTAHLLIGIDKAAGDIGIVETLRKEVPSNYRFTLFDPGYSTSSRHGGLYTNGFGGALRTILSFAANSRYVAYLDDDDWWSRRHLARLRKAIEGKDWAFSLRWFVDHETGWPICQDEWDALGPGKGINKKRFGGFVNPSCLMVDKLACAFDLPYWSFSPFPEGNGEDRLLFRQLLKHKKYGASGKATCFYDLRIEDLAYPHHARAFAARSLIWMYDRSQIKTIESLAARALEALEQQEPAKAAQAWRKSLVLNPAHVPSLCGLAKWEADQGHLAKARTLAAKAYALADTIPTVETLYQEITRTSASRKNNSHENNVVIAS